MMESFSDDGVQSRISEIIQSPGQEKQEQLGRGVSNLSKLGYQQLFYQRGQNIVVQELGVWQRSCSLKQFTSFKQIYEKGIKTFKTTNSPDESDGMKRRRRTNSIDTDIIGAYYLNNWLSHQDYPCEKASVQEKTAFLLYQIVSMRWAKALQVIGTFDKTPEIATLQYILIGFRAISSLLTEQDKTLTDIFLGRLTHEIKVRQSHESIGGTSSNFVNVLEQDSKSKFFQIKSLAKRVQCLRINLQFLVKFVGNYKVKSQDSYIQLCFKFLGNSSNQQDLVPVDKDFFNMLLRLDLKLSDRINLANKLLNDKKRRQFCIELDDKLQIFPRLQNILFYTAHPVSKHREQKIQQIVCRYLDQYGDLETIAYLAHQFPFLKKYYSQFRQALQLAYEHKQLERLENYKWSNEKQGFKEMQECKKGGRKACSFFDCVNLNDDKIQFRPKIETARVCEICSKKIGKGESYLQCGKCRHGGHLPHLLKWFEEYDNCAHIGCPCLCN